MEQAVFDKPLELIPTGDDKYEYDGNYQTYQDKIAIPSKHRGQVF